MYRKEKNEIVCCNRISRGHEQSQRSSRQHENLNTIIARSVVIYGYLEPFHQAPRESWEIEIRREVIFGKN